MFGCQRQHRTHTLTKTTDLALHKGGMHSNMRLLFSTEPSSAVVLSAALTGMYGERGVQHREGHRLL